MALNLHLVRVFAAVVAAGSFSRAADDLSLSQPAVSRAVQELERQLGTLLLDRAGRRVAPTSAGRLLYDHAVELFAIEQGAEAALADLEGLERGRLAIGASTTVGIYLLPSLLGAFHRRHPGVGLFLDIGNTAQIAERLRTTPLDVAFVEGPVAGSDLVVERWRDDDLVVIAAPDHPIAARQPVALADLAGEPFVLRERGSGTREVAEDALRGLGVEPLVAMELGSTEAVKQAVAAGLGVSVMSSAAISLEVQLDRLAVLVVPELQIRRPLNQLHVRGRAYSRASLAFLALARAEEVAVRTTVGAGQPASLGQRGRY